MFNLFIKTFDPLIMSGFRNKQELQNYWFFSQIGTGFIGLGAFGYLMDYLIHNINIMNEVILMFVVFLYFLIFTCILGLPFIVNWFFNRILPNSLPYWYVSYMWMNSKNSILIVLKELPPEAITVDELIKLHQNTDIEQQIKLLIKLWHKNFSNELKQNFKESNE